MQALERRKVNVSQLVDALGRRKVLEAVLAQVAQAVRLEEGGGGGGDQHLSTVAGGGDAGGAVHVGAHVALLGQVGSAGVDADAYADGAGRESLERLRGSG